MEAKELRIGNWIKCLDIESEVWRDDIVVRLDDDIYTKDEINGNACANYGYHPIPLTEEWLLKFGFVYHDVPLPFYKMYICRTHGYLSVNAYSMEVEVGASGYKAIGIKDCKVHQLQNLYFALTQKELEI